jgi:hypothetical protein
MATKINTKKKMKEELRLRRLMKREERFLNLLDLEMTEYDAQDYFLRNEIRRQRWA